MTAKENKALLKEFIYAGNANKDSTHWDRLCAPEFIMHANNMDALTLEQSKKYFQALHEAFPDSHFTIEEMIAEGDKISARYTWQATHKGSFRGISPTGKRISCVCFEIDRISKGKFVETWLGTDNLSLLTQLGVTPGAPSKL